MRRPRPSISSVKALSLLFAILAYCLCGPAVIADISADNSLQDSKPPMAQAEGAVPASSVQEAAPGLKDAGSNNEVQPPVSSPQPQSANDEPIAPKAEPVKAPDAIAPSPAALQLPEAKPDEAKPGESSLSAEATKPLDAAAKPVNNKPVEASKTSEAKDTPTAPNVLLSAPLASDGRAVDPANTAVNLHPEGKFAPPAPFDPSPSALLKSDSSTAPPVPLVPAAPLAILNVEVAPGSASRLAWSPEDSFSGIATPTPVLVVHGAKPGPRVCLSAAVHGDEINGIEVVRHILYNLNPNELSGTVIGVPIVNMQGFRRNSRYLADRRDLNRFFPGNAQGSAASRLAASFFNDVIVNCHYLVDIHTGSFSRTNLPQLRADLSKPLVVELAKNLGDIAVLHNRGAKGSLRRAAQDRGIPSVTLEAGEPYTFQEPAIERSVKSIEHLLHQLAMYSFNEITPRPENAMFYRAQWLRAKAGGMLFNKVALGQQVQTGQLLGTVTDPITNQSSEIRAPRDGLIIGMALNQVMQPGFAAYHLGYPATLAEAAQNDAGPEDFGADAAIGDNGDPN